jgi:AraC-like DNA-binding protein
MNNGYQDHLTIDRIDVNGNYEPGNCRWVTRIVQANNTTRNHYLLYKGEKHTMAELARILNMDYDKFKHKLKKGELKTICQDMQEN